MSGKPREPSAEDLILGFAQNVRINQNFLGDIYANNNNTSGSRHA